MISWFVLQPQFAQAFVDAFNQTTLTILLQHRHNRELNSLAAIPQPFPAIIDDVIRHAVRDGWLEELAVNARDTQRTHKELGRTVTQLLTGIKHEGKAYYQFSLDLTSLRPYLNWMQAQSRILPLGPLDPSGRDTASLHLDDVFVRLDVDKAGSEVLTTGQDAIYTAALGHLHTQKQLVLLGDPGSGKSTLLRYLIICLCNHLLDPESNWFERLSWIVTERRPTEIESSQPSRHFRELKIETHRWKLYNLVPIFVQLRDFANQSFNPQDENAIWQFICHQIPDALSSTIPTLSNLALNNSIFFMFDGIDEVSSEQRKQVWQAIGAWLKSPHGENRWIVTCRILSYVEEELPLRHLPIVTLQKFDSTQIDSFITDWYRTHFKRGVMSLDAAQDKTAKLQDACRGYLQELAQNPMLLTIMAIVQTYEGSLPDARAKLYQRCVETLLLRWQHAKDGENETGKSILQELACNPNDLERLLWKIGWKAHSQVKQRDRAADLPEWDVLQIAREGLGSLEKAEKFLSYTEKKAHLLIGKGGARNRFYTFPHRTFQEYLAACHLISDRPTIRRIASLAESGDQWREVVNLAFGRLVHVNVQHMTAIDIVRTRMIRSSIPTDEIGWRLVWFVGEACAVIGRQSLANDEDGAELLPIVRKQLVTLLERGMLTARQRAEAGDVLAILGDPRPGVCTREPDMLLIDAGTFKVGRSGQEGTIDRPYHIARYPVTVAQFTNFVDAGGYQDARYWGGEDSDGWRWCMVDHELYRGADPITHPQHWKQPKWHIENRPIVGVSWYEAMAYCRWLSEVTAKSYRLPNEIEWERAARHIDSRDYAWGNYWYDGIINSSEARIRRTTTVGIFPDGVAECGAHDMSGNIWEWTQSVYKSFYNVNQNAYCARGGAWYYNHWGANVAFRTSYFPHKSDRSIGFRVVFD